MAQAISSDRIDDQPETWQTQRARRVHVHTLPGSWAASQAAAEAQWADKVVAALESLLGPDRSRHDEPLEIYLIDRVTAGDAAPVLADTSRVVHIVQPDAPAEPLAWPITRALVARWFGVTAATPGPIVDGIAGIADARIRGDETASAATDTVAARLAAREPISIFARSDTAFGTPSDIAARQTATAFVAWLLKTFDETALRTYLMSVDPNRRDQAASEAFHRPLGALEETWLAQIGSPPSDSPLRALLRHMLPLFRPYWARQLEVFLYMAVGLAYTVVLPLATKYIFDTLIPHGNKTKLVAFVIGLLLLYLLNAAVDLRQSYVSNWIDQRILIELEERMFAHLQRLPHSFYSKAKVGDLMSRLSNDLNIVQQAMSTLLGTGIFMLLKAIAAAITILALSLTLGAVVLLVVPLFAAGYVLLRKHLRDTSLELQRLGGEVAAFEQESLSAHGVIKAFGMEDRSVAFYHARLMSVLRAMMRMVVLSSLFQTSMTMATTLGQLVVLGVGGFLVIQGNLTLGTLVAFIGLLSSLFTPIAGLSGLGQTVQKASGSLQRITELLDEPVTIADAPDATPAAPLSHDIRFEHVTFGYDPQRATVRDLSFTIPAGAKVAFVGPSGAGKSTIVNLLMRFWDPSEGRILLDGKDVRDLTLASVRGQIGLVFQETFVFDSSVRDNIGIGEPGATDAEIRSAAEAAQLADFIESLPASYDTVLGERGVRMSGGQRQRLAIARALLRDPRILLLDEATSALDPGTEADIQATLDRAAESRTTISITHRLTSVTKMDRIFVLDQGRIVEQGTHDELMAAGGLYQGLYKEQTGVGTTARARRRAVESDRLRHVPLFKRLDAGQLDQIADRLTVERYAPGTEIVHQGDEGETMHFISSGQVDVLCTDGAVEYQVNTLRPGDYFGEMALLTGEPRSATIRAAVPTETWSLTRTDFTALMESTPQIREAITRTMAERRAALAALHAAA